MKAFLELGRIAMSDPSLISNHVQNGCVEHLIKFANENLELIDLLDGDKDHIEMVSEMKKECVEAKIVLEFYQSAA